MGRGTNPLGQQQMGDAIGNWWGGVKQRFGLLVDDPVAFMSDAVDDVIPTAAEMQQWSAAGRPTSGAVWDKLNNLALAGVTIHHGTPHLWKPEAGFPQGRPRLDKIGTGEGNQSYGHGWYAAEAKEVGQRYRDALAQYQTTIDGQIVTPKHPQFDSVMSIAAQGYDKALAAAERALKAGFVNKKAGEQAVAKIKALKGANIKQSKGGIVYTLDLPDEVVPQLLDWDAPVTAQAPAVRAAIKKATMALPDSAIDDLGGDLSLLYSQYITPGMFLNTMESIGGRADFGESLLRQQGIPGLRYLDGGSRNAAQGTRNFVIWDQSLLDQMARRGLLVE